MLGHNRGMGIWLGQKECQLQQQKSLLSQRQSKASCQTSGSTARLPVRSFPRPPRALVTWNALHHGKPFHTYPSVTKQTEIHGWGKDTCSSVSWLCFQSPCWHSASLRSAALPAELYSEQNTLPPCQQLTLPLTSTFDHRSFVKDLPALAITGSLGSVTGPTRGVRFYESPLRSLQGVLDLCHSIKIPSRVCYKWCCVEFLLNSCFNSAVI